MEGEDAAAMVVAEVGEEEIITNKENNGSSLNELCDSVGTTSSPPHSSTENNSTQDTTEKTSDYSAPGGGSKTRHWEKRWVKLGHLQVYKWTPIDPRGEVYGTDRQRAIHKSRFNDNAPVTRSISAAYKKHTVVEIKRRSTRHTSRLEMQSDDLSLDGDINGGFASPPPTTSRTNSVMLPTNENTADISNRPIADDTTTTIVSTPKTTTTTTTAPETATSMESNPISEEISSVDGKKSSTIQAIAKGEGREEEEEEEEDRLDTEDIIEEVLVEEDDDEEDEED